MPLRWFAITQNWRYERMTRGRKREHYQWNMDVWGEPGVAAEAELIAAIVRGCSTALGLGRGDGARAAQQPGAARGDAARAACCATRPEALRAALRGDRQAREDRRRRRGRAARATRAGALRLAPAEARDVVALLGVASLDEAAAAAPPDSAAVADLRRLFELLDAYGVADRVDFDASVVRGLAYYTGVVFEAFDAGRKLRAVAGGGRYDRLLETLGGPSIPAVGFGFGDVVVARAARRPRARCPSSPRGLDDVVCALGEAQRPAAIRAGAAAARGGPRRRAGARRRASRSACSPTPTRAGARRVLLIGPDEAARGVVKVRELGTGAEHDEPLS